MNKIKVVQVELRSESVPAELLTTWVDSRPELRVGMRIKLKDFKPDLTWEIIELYSSAEHDADEFDWHRKWTNNI